MTPMQKLKNELLIFKEYLPDFKEINLNKAKPKQKCIQNVDNEYLLSFPSEDGNFSLYEKKVLNQIL